MSASVAMGFAGVPAVEKYSEVCRGRLLSVLWTAFDIVSLFRR